MNGLVNMDTVRSLYDMILDHARSYVVVKPLVSKAVVDKTKTSGCFNCGSTDHWYADCPRKDEQYYGKGQSTKPGVNSPQQPAKGKPKGQPKGQSKGQPPDGQAAGVAKGKGKSGKANKKGGKKAGKGGKKGKYNPQVRECAAEEEYPT